VQKIGSLKELFNSPINEVSFDVKSQIEVDEISKILQEVGKTIVSINMTIAEKTLKFKLKNSRNLDRKSLNLLRKEEISSTIN
jgi:DNA polymerase-3 subunit alpha